MNNIPSQSALQALGTKQNVTANNIANMNTPGFDAQRASLEEVENKQGVRVQEIQDQNVQFAQGKEHARQNTEASDTDLVREMVNMIENESAYKANATTIRVNQQMTGNLFSLST